MTFRDIIKKCDKLYPNLFSLEEKMEFAGELAAIIFTRYLKETKSVTLAGGEGFSLPAEVTTDRVRKIFFDGERRVGSTVSGILANAVNAKEVRIEYIYIPEYTVDDSVPVSSPFDNLFLYYILAHICLHLEDVDGYNNYIAMYNALLLEYQTFLADSDSTGSGVRFKNLW